MHFKQVLGNYLKRISQQPPFPLTIQADESECGLASLTMILCAYGLSIDIELLRSRYGSTRGGMNIGELCEFSSSLGLRAIPTSNAIFDELTHPCIIFVRGEHFAVLWQIENSKYYVADPSDGGLVLDSEQFNEYYSGISISFRVIKSVFNELKATTAATVRPSIASLVEWKSLAVNFIIVLAVISAVLTLANAAAQDVFMTFVVEENEILWTRGLITATVGIAVLLAFTSLMMQITLQKQLQKSIYQWNTNLFKSLFRAPYSFFVNKTSGLIASRFNQIDEAVSGFQSALVSSLLGALNLIVYVIAVLLVSPQLALISAIGIAGFIFVGTKFYGFNIQNNYLLREAECDSAAAEFKLISGRDQIILEKAEPAIKRELSKAYAGIASAEAKTNIVGAYNEFFMSCIDQLLNTLLLVVSSILIVQGHLTTGTYAAISVIVQTALEPVRSLASIVETFQNSKLSFNTASELYQQELSAGDNPFDSIEQDESNSNSADVLQFKSVEFRYSIYDQTIFSDANLKIHSRTGKPLAVRLDGNTGSGKSTFMNLVLGLLTPVRGEVNVCGFNVSKLDQKSKNALVHYVDRDPTLVPGTVERNSMLGCSASGKDFKDAVSKLGFSELSIFASQSDRYIHDRNSLSTGQAVMISLVRAALIRPRLLLIDESLISIPEELHQGVIDGFRDIGVNLLVIQHGTSEAVDKLPTILMSQLQGSSS